MPNPYVIRLVIVNIEGIYTTPEMKRSLGPLLASADNIDNVDLILHP